MEPFSLRSLTPGMTLACTFRVSGCFRGLLDRLFIYSDRENYARRKGKRYPLGIINHDGAATSKDLKLFSPSNHMQRDNGMKPKHCW